MPTLRQRVLTVEGCLFLAILALALAVRLVGLGLAPLNPEEGARAMAAWRLQQGLPPGWWDAPTLVLLQAALFTLLGASDATARLASLVSGIALIPALWLFRSWLGRWPVLVAATFIAVSPSATAAASSSNEESLASLLTLLLGWGLLRYWDEGAGRFLLLGGIGAAALLNLGYPGIAGLVVLLVFGSGYATVRAAQSLPSAPPWSNSWPQLALPLVLCSLLLSSGFFLHFSGTGIPSLQAWTQHFEPTWEQIPWYRSWLLLGAGELPALLLGLPAAFWALRRWVTTPFSKEAAASAFFGVWSVLGLFFLLLGHDASLQRLSLIALPLIMLAGHLLGQAVRTLDLPLLKGAWLNLAGAGVLMVFAGLTLLQSASRPGTSLYPTTFIALLSIAVAVYLVSPYASTSRSHAIPALAGLALGIVASVHSLTTLSGPGHWPGAARVNPAAVTALTQLTALSPYTGEKDDRRLAVSPALQEALTWALRDTPSVEYVEQPSPEIRIYVTKEDLSAQKAFKVQGHSMTLLEEKDFQDWSPQKVWRWLIFGELSQSPGTSQRIVLLTRS